jgi:hypothetical protein
MAPDAVSVVTDNSKTSYEAQWRLSQRGWRTLVLAMVGWFPVGVAVHFLHAHHSVPASVVFAWAIPCVWAAARYDPKCPSLWTVLDQANRLAGCFSSRASAQLAGSRAEPARIRTPRRSNRPKTTSIFLNSPAQPPD